MMNACNMSKKFVKRYEKIVSLWLTRAHRLLYICLHTNIPIHENMYIHIALNGVAWLQSAVWIVKPLSKHSELSIRATKLGKIKYIHVYCMYVGMYGCVSARQLLALARQLRWRFIPVTYATSNLELAASRFLKEVNNWLWFGIGLAAATAAILAAAAANT